MSAPLREWGNTHLERGARNKRKRGSPAEDLKAQSELVWHADLAVEIRGLDPVDIIKRRGFLFLPLWRSEHTRTQHRILFHVLI